MRSALVLALLAAPCLAQDGNDAEVKSELQRLQGPWTYSELERDGKRLEGGSLKDRTFFIGADAFVVLDGGKLVQAGTVQVDPRKTPRTLNLVVKQGEEAGKTLPGIYTLDGDTLTACIDLGGDARPAEFRAGEGSNRLVFKARHPARPADEEVEIVGSYRSRTEGPGGEFSDYDVAIERRGESYFVTYSKNGSVLYVGTGLRAGNVLSMAWATQGQVGVSCYRIEKGPKLVGRYSTLGGIGVAASETLTPTTLKD